MGEVNLKFFSQLLDCRLLFSYHVATRLFANTKYGFERDLFVVNWCGESNCGNGLFVQFPLVACYKRAPLFCNIDKSVSQHKKIGQWLGLVFLLDPLLICRKRCCDHQVGSADESIH
ncbi:hypothetical protein ST37_00885 [Vibrio sp. qd031]|nr:hypothetical protein ST37_00885 [Vibrio sp. qd031]